MTSCLDITPSAPLKLIHIASKSFQRGKRTVVFPGFQSLKMFQNSTDARGPASWMWFLEGFPAKTSVAPERALESTENDLECGWKWPGSFAKWHPATSSWKTRQCSLLEGLDEFSETWPKWGSMQDGECLELATLERPIRESESGLWGTPRVGMARGGNFYYDRGKHNLEEQVGAAEYAKTWPTPMASDGNMTNNPRKDGRQNQLPNVVKAFPTPKARDWKDGTSKGPEGWTGDLGKAVNPSKDGGSLNPTWVEWLMGWPLGWTDLKPSGTGKFQAWLRSHGESSAKIDP